MIKSQDPHVMPGPIGHPGHLLFLQRLGRVGAGGT